MQKSGLNELLARLDWSQSELANRMEIAPETISRWVAVPPIVGLYLNCLLDRMTDIDTDIARLKLKLTEMEEYNER